MCLWVHYWSYYVVWVGYDSSYSIMYVHSVLIHNKHIQLHCLWFINIGVLIIWFMSWLCLYLCVLSYMCLWLMDCILILLMFGCYVWCVTGFANTMLSDDVCVMSCVLCVGLLVLIYVFNVFSMVCLCLKTVVVHIHMSYYILVWCFINMLLIVCDIDV